MRLLNVDTHELKFHPERPPPKYAILSHTWDDDEITFEDLTKSLEASKARKGFRKITGCSTLAKRQGYNYVWIDSCCIDKSSSAELSEAINSMFKWYECAEVCYVYLADVLDQGDSLLRSMSLSRWFTRGFTLQEFIAPRHVEFYSMGWAKLGDRMELASLLSTITAIDESFLYEMSISTSRSEYLRLLSVAKRMSWASKRETTREEDIAYCLLGIFDVNMPLLYGKGQVKAFYRLQEQIIRQTGDQTILAWHPPKPYTSRGWMANHPREFAGSATYIPTSSFSDFTVDEKGLQINEIGTPILEKATCFCNATRRTLLIIH